MLIPWRVYHFTSYLLFFFFLCFLLIYYIYSNSSDSSIMLIMGPLCNEGFACTNFHPTSHFICLGTCSPVFFSGLFWGWWWIILKKTIAAILLEQKNGDMAYPGSKKHLMESYAQNHGHLKFTPKCQFIFIMFFYGSLFTVYETIQPHNKGYSISSSTYLDVPGS